MFFNFQKEECKNQCQYCFSRWRIDSVNYSFLTDFQQNVVIYPLCDNDITDFDRVMKYLEECILAQTGFTILSISTKTRLSNLFLEKIKNFNKKYEKKGFIKLSVSFSCKSLISNIEPDASSYEERLQMLKHLKSLEIPTSAIFKPILPFIEIEEYISMIKDMKEYVNVFILGDLYVNKEDDFYKRYIKDNYNLGKRKIE